MQITKEISAEEKYQLIRQEILNLIKEHDTSFKIISKIQHNNIVINKNHFPIKKIIEFYTKFLDSYDSKISERFYYIYYDIREIVLCQYCQKNKSKYLSLTHGYTKYCSHKCFANSSSVQQKRKQTNLDRFGVEHVIQSEDIQQKMRNTNLGKFGVKVPAKSEEIQQKMKNTNLERYGVENTFQSEEIKENIRQINLDRHGVYYPSQSKEIRSIIKQTNLEKYGEENPSQVKEFKEKKIQTSLKKFGTTHPLQSEEIKEKSIQIQQQNFYNSLSDKDFIEEYEPLFSLDEYTGVKGVYYKFRHRKCGHIFQSRIDNGKIPKCPKCFPPSISNGEKEVSLFVEKYSNNITLNARNIIPPKELDIYLPDYNLAIEYNGIYWHSVDAGKDQRYHIDKTMACMRKGIKLIQIFENEWATTQDAVKSLILENIDQLPYYIDSKECTIKEVDKDEALDFLEVHNLYEPEDYDLRLGLYYQDQLASYMGLIKDLDSYIISNYCNHNFTEINSLPIFLDYLKDTKLIYYADLRFGRGKLFKDNGFEKNEYVPPQSICINENTIFDCGYIPYQKE